MNLKDDNFTISRDTRNNILTGLGITAMLVGMGALFYGMMVLEPQWTNEAIDKETCEDTKARLLAGNHLTRESKQHAFSKAIKCGYDPSTLEEIK